MLWMKFWAFLVSIFASAFGVDLRPILTCLTVCRCLGSSGYCLSPHLARQTKLLLPLVIFFSYGRHFCDVLKKMSAILDFGPFHSCRTGFLLILPLVLCIWSRCYDLPSGFWFLKPVFEFLWIWSVRPRCDLQEERGQQITDNCVWVLNKEDSTEDNILKSSPLELPNLKGLLFSFRGSEFWLRIWINLHEFCELVGIIVLASSVVNCLVLGILFRSIMAERDSVLSFKKLNELNYVSWKRDMLACLASKGLSKFIDPKHAVAAGATAADVTLFETSQSKAGGIIYLSIEDKLKCLLDGLEGPADRWDKLAKTYEPQSKARISRLLGEFHLAQMKENESIILFLNRITQLARDLSLAGKMIPDDDIAYRMMCTLPPQYHNVVGIMHRWDDAQFTAANVEKTLIEEFESLKSRELLGFTGKGKSKGSNANESVSFSHFSDSLIIDGLNVSTTDNEWIWDTGSGAHLCYDKNLFTELTIGKPYKMNAYAGTFDVEGIGTVCFDHMIGNKVHRITLNKVGYAPSGKRNLISGSRAMQAGCTWSGRSNEVLVRNKQNRPTLRFVEHKGLFKLSATKCNENLPKSSVKAAVKENCEAKTNVVESNAVGDLKLWHRRLMHTGVDSIIKMSSQEVVRDGFTPYEKMFGHKPNISYFRVIGSKCFRLLLKSQRDTKLGPVSKECILVGYCWHTKGYRVYDPEDDKLYNTQDVKFLETSYSDATKHTISFDNRDDDDWGHKVVASPTKTPILAKSEGIWERVAKQRPMTEKFPGRYDSTLSFEGKTFRSAKAVREFCADNDIEYADASVRHAFKNNNPFQGVWDIKDVAVGGNGGSSPDMSPDEGTSTSNIVDLSVYFNGLECSNAIEAPDRLDWESAMNDEETKLRAVALLNKAFKCVNLGRTKRFLGIDIIRVSGGIRFSQKSYIEGLFERFKSFGFKNVKEPFKVGMDLNDLNCEGDVLDANEYPYRTLVGILMFISRYTRPDICVAINILARYNSAPKAGMHFVKNDVEISKTKYIDVKIQFVKESYESKLFNLQYINTQKNLADILTKRVNMQKIADLCKYLDVYGLE
uniref:Reverse transcriptase Ty1/copia-type domain-containing protein n=1 Tax=Strigamia maritima TaxID=126957 RepID=T1IYF7_STRMM